MVTKIGFGVTGVVPGVVPEPVGVPSVGFCTLPAVAAVGPDL